MTHDEQLRLPGVAVSEGIAIGIAFFLPSHQDESIPEFPITIGEVDGEITRYRKALFSSREDLQRLQTHLVNEGSADAITIIDTHIQMLEDPLMTTHMEDKIRQMRQNTESVFRSVIHEYERKFSETVDSFFQQRLIDVMDLSKRILGHLRSKKTLSLSEIPANSVIFAKELTPSDTAGVQASQVGAFVTQIGGSSSHAALIARAKGIPYVICPDLSLIPFAFGKTVIVDGIKGEVIFDPKPSVLKKYQQSKNRLRNQYKHLEKENSLPAETLDGYPVNVVANIGNISDLDLFKEGEMKGIGLLRSEYLLLEKDTLLYSEEQQYAAYSEILQKAQGTSVVVRVFDIGADKNPHFYGQSLQEANPAMGCRGIRFLLRQPHIFKTQLRAILRSSLHGDVRILLPLISDLSELKLAKNYIAEVTQELAQQGIEVKKVPVGCMIELPSAVLICDLLAKECDFLSIGTNDLVQYTLGVDRTNPAVSDCYLPAHPSIIRMIKMIALQVAEQQKSLTLCGEIASNPLFIPLLLGLGIREFSCSPRFIPLIKKVVRQCSLVDVFQVAEKVLQMENTEEISQLLFKEYQNLVP